MDRLDNFITKVQNRILSTVYLDMRSRTNSSAKVHDYMEIIELANQEFKTNYQSLELERIAIEADDIKNCILKTPLKR